MRPRRPASSREGDRSGSASARVPGRRVPGPPERAHHAGPSSLAALALALALAHASCTRTEVLATPAARTAQIRRVAVMDFAYQYADQASPKLMNIIVAGSYVNTGAGRIIAESLAEELMQTGRYRIIERSRVEALLKEHEFQSSDFASPEGAKKIGKILGVDAVLVGSVDLFRFSWILFVIRADVSFRARLVDVETGEWIWVLRGRRATYFVPPEDAAAGLTRKLGRKMRRELESLSPASPEPAR